LFLAENLSCKIILALYDVKCQDKGKGRWRS
jgi:hypothetical protein